MAKKSTNIYKRKDGRWEGRYKNGYTASGKTRYSSVYGKSYSAVKELLEEKLAAIRNSYSAKSSYAFGEIAENWLADVQNKVKLSTMSNYTMKLNKHILPYFAGIKFDKLTADNINTFISDKIKEKLSEKYVADIVIMIKSIANFAQRRYGLLNRIESVTLPKSKSCSERRLLTVSERNTLKHGILSDPTVSNIGILLASATGIRIGELCALKWEDIDLEKSILTVKQTVQRICNNGKGTRLVISSPKSASSRREIPLPDFIVPILKNIKSSDSAYILSGNSKIVEPRTMQYRFKGLLKKLNIPYVNFHSLRHSFATSCVELGVDVKTLSEILGHSSVQLTLNRYVHSSIERKKSCMKIFSDSFAA